MKKYLVIGNPIDHSLSPKLHNYWIKKNNIKAIYEKMKINENDRILFSNVAKKHNLKKEGLLSMLFKRMLKKGISKNKGLKHGL